MAKKSFGGGLSSLLGNSEENKVFKDNKDFKEIKNDLNDLSQRIISKRSGNDRLRLERGYGRKTFIMDAELSEKIAAWAWYSRESEKELAAMAFEKFFDDVDPAELSKAMKAYQKK